MNTTRIEKLAKSINEDYHNVYNTVKLLEDDCSIPFIARYRKEKTGNLDEVKIETIKKEYQKIIELELRKTSILKSLQEQEKLTDDLQRKIDNADNIITLEDIYLPFKTKRKTKAVIAREKGLEPLALFLLKQTKDAPNIEAKKYITKDVANIEEALQGAEDIIAEIVNEEIEVRNSIRLLYERESRLVSKVAKGKDEEGIKYKDFFDYSELLHRCPSHRYLAVIRGETEGFLKVSLDIDTDKAINIVESYFVENHSISAQHVKTAIKDSFKRLIKPSIENEAYSIFKDKADEEAIRIFVENLRQLLLSPPLGKKRVLAIDPGFRTGCKIVCLDENGKLIVNDTIYPNAPKNDYMSAGKKILSLVNSCKIDAIAIGNGTASRETESFIKKIRFDKDIKVFVVSEAGASIYSASKIAREEFPEYDVTVRGAISIGRRLIDPLSELVKIDPSSIGVGQYQHDVNQSKLKDSLDNVVISCVNSVGVNLNNASKSLLQYVSGLNNQTAENIVKYIEEKGPITKRSDLLKVPRLGNKAFEQCVAFIRIPESNNPLDNSAVHPESYHIVSKIATDLNIQISNLIGNKDVLSKIDVNKYIDSSIGLYTLTDILKELEKPNRDIRKEAKVLEFDKKIKTIEDLHEGMILPGVVTNLTAFGAFVDIGIKENGLIHISQMSDVFISNPAEVVKLHQHLKVKIIEIDISRKRIQLTLKDVAEKD